MNGRQHNTPKTKSKMIRMRGSASQALAGQGVTPKRYERERERRWKS